MQVRVVYLLIILAVASVAIAQSPLAYPEEKNWRQICEQAKAEPLTVPQISGPLSTNELKHCDETALYYGFGDKPNYPAALQCGWYERAHPQEQVANMYYGPGVLTMLYANGQGVPRNNDLAIRMACEQTWASDAEMEGRIGHLEHLQTLTIDLCDDITSGLGMGTCAGVGAGAADAVRAKRIAVIEVSLPTAARTTFSSLRAAEDAFEETHVRTEIDLSGSARAMFQFEDQMRLRDQFLINLQRFGRGDIPAASNADLARLDHQLNAVYQQIQQAPSSAWEWGTIRPEGIVKTQRAWLKLVDAWVSFARTGYPTLSEARVRAQLIRLRLHQLRSIAPNES